VRLNGQAIQTRPDFPITNAAQLFGAAGYDTAAFASVGFLMPIAADFASQDVSPRLEQSNLAAIPSAQRDAMKAAAERQFRVLGAVANEPRPVDPHTLEELKGLGYLP